MAYTMVDGPLHMNPPMNPAGSILLADDHGLRRHGQQLLVAEVLPQLRVQRSSSPAETAQALQTLGRFDLVLLGLTLSDVHGLAGLHRLRDEFPPVPVVVLSAQDDRDTVLAAQDGGAMGFISKAAAPAGLKEAPTRVLIDHRIHLPQSVSGGMAAVPAMGADGSGGRCVLLCAVRLVGLAHARPGSRVQTWGFGRPGGSGAVAADEVTRCAQAKVTGGRAGRQGAPGPARRCAQGRRHRAPAGDEDRQGHAGYRRHAAARRLFFTWCTWPAPRWPKPARRPTGATSRARPAGAAAWGCCGCRSAGSATGCRRC
ncbi:MAG: hypothetical protein C0505_00320 [Leptothrix sp. (in: Bacteria)]|nr:hypothetical protein [Leptothrix sp. (in: b-proteobacteria)]